MPARSPLVDIKLQQKMKITLTLIIIIAFAGIASGQQNCNNEFKATAGVQDIGAGEMSPILGFNYALFGGKDIFGGFIEAKYLNAETVTWIGAAYKTNFHEEFSDKEFESKAGVGIRSDSTSELFVGAEAKIQFPYFIFSAGCELNMEKDVEYEFIAQYAMCPSSTYFGIAADSHNGIGFRATQLFEFNSSVLSLNCGVMSNDFHTMKSDDFRFTSLDPMIHMMIGLRF